MRYKKQKKDLVSRSVCFPSFLFSLSLAPVLSQFRMYIYERLYLILPPSFCHSSYLFGYRLFCCIVFFIFPQLPPVLGRVVVSPAISGHTIPPREDSLVHFFSLFLHIGWTWLFHVLDGSFTVWNEITFVYNTIPNMTVVRKRRQRRRRKHRWRSVDFRSFSVPCSCALH